MDRKVSKETGPSSAFCADTTQKRPRLNLLISKANEVTSAYRETRRSFPTQMIRSDCFVCGETSLVRDETSANAFPFSIKKMPRALGEISAFKRPRVIVVENSICQMRRRFYSPGADGIRQNFKYHLDLCWRSKYHILYSTERSATVWKYHKKMNKLYVKG